jgi:hypothetical protein
MEILLYVNTHSDFGTSRNVLTGFGKFPVLFVFEILFVLATVMGLFFENSIIFQ